MSDKTSSEAAEAIMQELRALPGGSRFFWGLYSLCGEAEGSRCALMSALGNAARREAIGRANYMGGPVIEAEQIDACLDIDEVEYQLEKDLELWQERERRSETDAAKAECRAVVSQIEYELRECGRRRVGRVRLSR